MSLKNELKGNNLSHLIAKTRLHTSIVWKGVSFPLLGIPPCMETCHPSFSETCGTHTEWTQYSFFFSQTYQWESVRSGILISNLRIVWGNIRWIARVTKSVNKENITWISEKNLTCQREISWHPLSIPSPQSLDCPFLQDKTNPLLSILTNVHSHLRKGVVIMIRYFSEDRKIAVLLSTFCFTTPRNSLSTYKYHQNWYVVSYLMYILNVKKK